jgi:hypothetical protein
MSDSSKATFGRERKRWRVFWYLFLAWFTVVPVLATGKFFAFGNGELAFGNDGLFLLLVVLYFSAPAYIFVLPLWDWAVGRLRPSKARQIGARKRVED